MAKECYICEEAIKGREYMVLLDRHNRDYKNPFGHVHHECLATAAVAAKNGLPKRIKKMYEDGYLPESLGTITIGKKR